MTRERRAIRDGTKRLDAANARRAATQAFYSGFCGRLSCACHTDPAAELRTPSDWTEGPAWCCRRCRRDDDGNPQPITTWEQDQQATRRR